MKLVLLVSLSLIVVSCDKQSTPKAFANTSTSQVQNNNQVLDNKGRIISSTPSIGKTPSDQSETESDRKITQAIRRALIADNAFSITEKNIKITTIDGVVTLRGNVSSNKEKNEIIKKLASIPGIIRVESQLTISRD